MKLFSKLKLQHENEVDFSEWSKKLIRTYWYVALIITVAAAFLLIGLILNNEYEIKFEGVSYFQYILTYLIYPFLMIAVCIILSSIGIKIFGEKRLYTMQAFICLLCLTMMSSIATITHYTVNGIYMSFSFVCFISLIYIDRKLVIFAAIISGLTYLLIAVFFLMEKSATGEIKHGVEEIFTTLALISTAAAITMHILSRKQILISNVVQMKDGILYTMADLVENRDNNTGGHVERTTVYMELLTNAIQEAGIYADDMDDWDLDSVISSARLHDVGKITISDAILNKPGRLTDEEFNIMKTHTTEGERIIEKTIERTRNALFLKNAKIIAAYHHERWDGSGYPYGLKDVEIPLLGRLMAIVDVYDALVSERPYKKAFSHEEAMDIIKKDAGKHFDPILVGVFLSIGAQVAAVREIYK
ncbi:MAG: HD domain-containing protein [Lachnospiraceae bacterium]|nr:HD domain-containing protein [Lachnospiraceae bacterium]